MTSPSEPRTPRFYHAKTGPSFSPLGALGVVLAAMGTLVVIGGVAAQLGAPLYAALAIGQVSMLGLVLGVARTWELPLRGLGVERAPGRILAAAVLIGASAWFLNMLLVELLVPVQPTDLHEMRQLVEQPPLVLVLLTVALAPAVCEEVVFRGVLLRGLASRLPVIAALPIASAMFAAYHLKPLQMIPTFTLGLLLGALVLRAGSILPSVIAHFLNNAIAILVARNESSWFAHAVSDYPGVAVAVFATLLIGELARLPRRPGPPWLTASSG